MTALGDTCRRPRVGLRIYADGCAVAAPHGDASQSERGIHTVLHSLSVIKQGG